MNHHNWLDVVPTIYHWVLELYSLTVSPNHGTEVYVDMGHCTSTSVVCRALLHHGSCGKSSKKMLLEKPSYTI